MKLDTVQTTYWVAANILMSEAIIREELTHEMLTPDTRERISREINSKTPEHHRVGKELLTSGLWRDIATIRAVQYWLVEEGHFLGPIDSRPSRELWLAEQRALQRNGWARDPDPIPLHSSEAWVEDGRVMVEIENPFKARDHWTTAFCNLVIPRAIAKETIEALELITRHYNQADQEQLGLNVTGPARPGTIVINPEQNRPHWRQDRAANAQPQMATVHQALRGAGYECVGIHTNQHWDVWTSTKITNALSSGPYFGAPGIWPQVSKISKPV